ncbi:hypothetical protein D3C78_1545750 [compost metagenome]
MRIEDISAGLAPRVLAMMIAALLPRSFTRSRYDSNFASSAVETDFTRRCLPLTTSCEPSLVSGLIVALMRSAASRNPFSRWSSSSAFLNRRQ